MPRLQPYSSAPSLTVYKEGHFFLRAEGLRAAAWPLAVRVLSCPLAAWWVLKRREAATPYQRTRHALRRKAVCREHAARSAASGLGVAVPAER